MTATAFLIPTYPTIPHMRGVFLPSRLARKHHASEPAIARGPHGAAAGGGATTGELLAKVGGPVPGAHGLSTRARQLGDRPDQLCWIHRLVHEQVEASGHRAGPIAG